MLRGRHGGLGPARIDHHHRGLLRVATDPLPQDGVGNAEVRAHQDDDVRLLEVPVGEWGRIESEGLLVRGHRGGHALPGVAVPVDHAHAELAQSTEQASSSVTIWPVPSQATASGARRSWMAFQRLTRTSIAAIQDDRLELSPTVTQKRHGGAIGGGQRSE